MKNKNRHIIFLTVVIGIMSEFVHPDMKTWVSTSIVAHMICCFFIARMIYFSQKNKEKFAASANATVASFLGYAVITEVAYLRVVDRIVAGGPLAIVIVATIVAPNLFFNILFWSDRKQPQES